jgi:hypothetical protein
MGVAGRRAVANFRGLSLAWAAGIYSGLDERVTEGGVHVGCGRGALGRDQGLRLCHWSMPAAASETVPADH